MEEPKAENKTCTCKDCKCENCTCKGGTNVCGRSATYGKDEVHSTVGGTGGQLAMGGIGAGAGTGPGTYDEKKPTSASGGS